MGCSEHQVWVWTFASISLIKFLNRSILARIFFSLSSLLTLTLCAGLADFSSFVLQRRWDHHHFIFQVFKMSRRYPSNLTVRGSQVRCGWKINWTSPTEKSSEQFIISDPVSCHQRWNTPTNCFFFIIFQVHFVRYFVIILVEIILDGFDFSNYWLSNYHSSLLNKCQ